MPLVYTADLDAYGPLGFDDLLYSSQVPLGSPQPVAGADAAGGVGDIKVVVNEAPNIATVNNFPNAYSNKNYRVVVLDLSAAALNVEINFQGTMVIVVWGDTGAATPSTLNADTSAYCFLKFNDQAADDIPASPGFQLSGIPYNKIYVTYPAQSTKKIYLLLSSDQPIDRLDAGM